MSIVRVERKSQPYTMIANATLQDTSISLEARGLLTYLLSKPDNWAVVVTWLADEMGVGREKLNRIIRELENAGYIETRVVRDGGQFAQYERIVHETPTADGFTVVGKPDSGETDSGKSGTIKERVNKEQTEERNDVIIEAALPLVSRMQELRQDILGDKFPETKAQKGIMAVLVRQHSAETVRTVMEWAMADSFWATVIITPTLLHKHFGKLKAQQLRSKPSAKSVYEQYLENNPEEGDDE